MLCDAHCHYHFLVLTRVWKEAASDGELQKISGAVVNGTCAEDWPEVRDFVRQHSWARAAYGIHPWQAPQRSADWEACLRRHLLDDPGASVGEIGLDGWIAGHDAADQKTLFLRQWGIAVELERPVTVHCVRAWEPLRQAIRQAPRSRMGFLIHAYNGPPEWIPQWVEWGGYFSFSPYFLWERKKAQREAFRLMPRERILIETDAPALGPPPALNPFPLKDPATGDPVNHPANLEVACRALAEVLECSRDEAADLTSGNWSRLFGGGLPGIDV